jgi:hypothetical protein
VSVSLPACQQRVLDRMEGALRASEPHMASMYAIFARLNAAEPIGAEQLARRRQRWFQPGTTMYAIVLIPVMFAAIIVGALLGGSARSVTACEASYSVGGVSPLAGRPSCPTSGSKAAVAKTTVRKTIAAKARLACTGAGPVSQFTTRTHDEQAFPPAARVDAIAAGSSRTPQIPQMARIPGMCEK